MPGSYWSSIKFNASYRGIPFEGLTKEDAWNKFVEQDGKCALTGELLVFESESNASDGTASLDRIDSSKGYTKENIQWVHKNVNYIKRDLPNDEFIEWCKKVAKHNTDA